MYLFCGNESERLKLEDSQGLLGNFKDNSTQRKLDFQGELFSLFSACYLLWPLWEKWLYVTHSNQDEKKKWKLVALW